MNKETAIGRINKIGKAGHIIALIARIVVIVGLVCTLIGLITLAVLPKDLFAIRYGGNGSFTLDLGDAKVADELMSNDNRLIEDMTISLNGDRLTAGEASVRQEGTKIIADLSGEGAAITPMSIIKLLATVIVYLGVTVVIVIFIELFCKALEKCVSPFDDAVIKALERLAWALIPWAFISTTAKSIMSSAFSTNTNISVGVNLTTILGVLLIFGLAQIFKYGALLQAESDETL